MENTNDFLSPVAIFFATLVIAVALFLQRKGKCKENDCWAFCKCLFVKN